MAYAFGDSSFLKLPPITGESTVEIDDENSKRSSSGVVRDKHGLVRLPPIVRLDSLRSTPSTGQAFLKTPAESEYEMPTQRSNSKISHKIDALRQGSSKKLRKYAEKREDEKKLIQTPATKETVEVETSVLDSEDWSHAHEKARRLRSKERSEALSLYKDSFASRRGSATFKTTLKLSRSRRLAKSSPELSLCNRKINLKNRAGGSVNDNTVTTFPAVLSPENCSHATHARLSIHDIDGSVLSRLQNTAKMDEKLTKRGRSQKVGQSAIYQPLSTPNSPVCSESTNKEQRQKSRKSLNDITETVKQFIDRRRPSVSPPKKQNLVDETVGLKIEGKSCPHAESRELVGELTCTPTVANVNSLHPPQHNEKRHSLYDLQQILSLLQKEDLKRQSSSTSSPPQSSSAGSNGSVASKPTNASVYDLREFLKLAVAVETSNGKPMTKPLTKPLTDKTQGEASSARLLSPKQERREHHRDGARKGSVYDLMEFLSLGNTGDSASASTSENSSRSASPRVLFSPRSSKEMLFVGEPTEARRSSTYDLMEFLSLPRSGETSRPESRQSSTSSQGDQPSSKIRENENSATDRKGREARSLSVYDLAEYLATTTGVPPLVRVTTSDEEQTESYPTVLDSPREGERGNAYKRESVYDLREMLNVMQQENETKRESLYNLPEILSYFHREVDAKEQERETATRSENSSEERKAPLTIPSSSTVRSGYSSDSLSSATDSNSLQANDTSASRQMSAYDLREFLSLYAAQKSAPNQQIPLAFKRKASNVSQSAVSIHVTDEWNRSLDLETDDVFLPVSRTDENAPELRKRSSVYDLCEFLDMLNADDSPLRRRLSSVSIASSKSSESESESNHPGEKSDTKLAGANESVATSRPQLSPRQDSGGSVSLYDLGEFLSLLNTDESPLRRRLSSASDLAVQGDSRTPRDHSEKSSLHSLGEILTVLNDLEQKRVNENVSGESEIGSGDEISIPVPLLSTKNEKTNAQAFSARKRLTSQKPLTSVSERSEEKTKLSL